MEEEANNAVAQVAMTCLALGIRHSKPTSQVIQYTILGEVTITTELERGGRHNPLPCEVYACSRLSKCIKDGLVRNRKSES
jgi:hypothetical protein